MQDRLSLNSSAKYLKGVGPKIYKLLGRLGIYTVEDLLYNFPVRYEDRSNFTSISKVDLNKTETIKGEVLTTSLRRARMGMNIFQAAIRDKTGIIYAVWFNQPYLKQYIRKGMNLILHGKIERSYQLLQITSPEYEVIRDETDFIHMGRVVPIYRLTKNLNQKRLRKIVFNAISLTSKVEEFLPSDVIKRQNLTSLSEALKKIHFPTDEDKFLQARRRLVFDEFFLLQILVAFKRISIMKSNTGIVHVIKQRQLYKLEELLEFELTDSQRRVINQIMQDMCSSQPMNRLLQGDVGSGKTVVSIFASLLSLSNGYQVAFMVPTAILALQHYKRFKSIFSKLNFNTGILISSLDTETDRKIRSEIKEGKLNIVIGTHSLIQEKVNFNKLGLIIIDEQHRFGVLQRAKLQKKGQYPDVLIMTATPIPRTLTMTLYGEMDVSVIDSLPPGRKLAKTCLIKSDKKIQAYNFIKDKLIQGRQCYIVYPLIEESEKMDLRAAKRMYEKLKDGILKEFKLGLLHGRLNPEERDKVLDAFIKNKINVLVTTLVIEVGINIPNASVLMIENAERFGLSQLHQLRGRISRAGFQPYCVLVSDTRSEEAKQRLESLLETTDGFKIAERDLVLRGPGEFVGTKQHGITEFKIANLLKDIKILLNAREEAFNIVNQSPNLKGDVYRKLRKRINLKYKKQHLQLIGA